MKFNNIYKILLLLLLALPTMAERIVEEGEKKPVRSNKRLKARCENASAQADLDVNNVRARIMNGGDMWWDLVGSAKYEIPKVPTGSTEPKRHSLFAGSIWIGGYNNGSIVAAAQTYRQFGGNDFWPGPMDTTSVSVDDGDCSRWDKIFQVTKDEIEEFVEEFEKNGSVVNVPRNIRDWPGNGNDEYNESFKMAPYVNVGGGPGYDYAAGDYPDINGDKALWYVYNDVGNLKTETNSPEIGLEFRTMAFAIETDDEINNMTFYETTIINRGQKQVDSTYFGQWVDADLGYAFDDYVGCDIERGLGICYNGDNFDDGAFGYGANPPSVGVDFFEGPVADAEMVFEGGFGDGVDNDGDGEVDEMDSTYFYWLKGEGMTEMPIIYEGDGIDNDKDGLIDEPNETISMSKFVYYNNDRTTIGNPSALNDFYNYLISNWRNGDCIKYGGNGFSTSTGGCTDYMFPDDPRDPDGWSEVTANNQPADRRFLQSAGPFTLKPGAVNKVTIGIVWSRASSGGNTGSYDLLLLADDEAQKLFYNDFNVLDGPVAPEVATVEMDREVIVIMDREDYLKAESYTDFEISNDGVQVDYYFQGYQIYQLATSQVSGDQLKNPDMARVVFQVDLNDGITRLVNNSLSEELGSLIPEVMVDGNDEGLEHVFRITDDAFASGNSKLINNKQYHYMLVAYAAVDQEVTDALENYLGSRKPHRFTVTPRKTDILYDGLKLNSAYGDSPELTRIEGKGNGGIFLRLTEESIASILEENEFPQTTYQVGAGPVKVKIIDPIKLSVGDFELKFIDTAAAGTNNKVLLADIASLITKVRDRKGTLETQSGATEDAFEIKQLTDKELAQKRTLLEKSIKELNGKDSTFHRANKIVLETEIKQLVLDSTVFTDLYLTEKESSDLLEAQLEKSEKELVDKRAQAESVGWVLIKTNADGTQDSVYYEKGIFTDNEMVIEEWGLSIQVGPEFAPKRSADDATNGYIGSELIYEDDSKEWLSAMPQVENISDQVPYIFDWIRAGSAKNQDNTRNDAIHDVAYDNMNVLDQNAVYKDVLNQMIAPYMLTSRSTSFNGFSTYGVCQAPSVGEECRNLYDLPSINLVFTNDRSKWSRVVVAEMGEDPSRTEGNAEKFHLRQHASLELEPDASGDPVYSTTSTGFSWFPGYAIDVETGQRLNIILGENSLIDREYTRDMIWNPSSTLVNPNIPINADGGAIVGGMHYIYVVGSTSRFEFGGGEYESAYDGCEQIAKYLDPSSGDYNKNRHRGAWSACAWVMPAMLSDGYSLKSWGEGIVPTTTTARIRINRPYMSYATSETSENQNLPYYKFNTGSVAPEKGKAIGAKVLKDVGIVPNPYYAQSDYEGSQIDNTVKLINLPEVCTINIYTINGLLVKQFKRSASNEEHTTQLNWDLKNDAGVPISSGAYIINVEAPTIGESTTLKFFAVIKPIDLDTF